MRRGIQAALIGCAFALASCGSTQITTNDPSARIYVNGAYEGTGTAEVRRRGIPGSAEVRAVAPDGRSHRSIMKRRFTVTTLAAGLLTYMVGWAVAWEYPDTVFLPLEAPPAAAQPDGASWDDGGGDIWMQPPPGWTPPAQPQDAPAATEPTSPTP